MFWFNTNTIPCKFCTLNFAVRAIDFQTGKTQTEANTVYSGGRA
jgi:hypothetical protein